MSNFENLIIAFLLGMVVMIIISINIYTHIDVNYEVYKRIVPIVKIECVNNKCDTTYIYTITSDMK